MQSDLTYAIYIVIAALAVGAITLGGTAYAYFAEERWGTAKTTSPRAAEAEAAEPERPERTTRDEQRDAREDHDLAA